MDYNPSSGKFSVSRYLYYLTGLGIACVLILVTLVSISVNVSSGMRAYVAGEGYWTKAQKEAALNLQNYIYTGDDFYFNRFSNNLIVNLGDRIAREELSKEEFDYQVAYDGFLKGMNHPEDIPHLISVFRKFSWFSKVKTAIAIWEEGDRKIEELIALGEDVNQGFSEGDVTEGQKQVWSDRLWAIDSELTALEVSFSNAMGDMARFLDKLLKFSYMSMGLIMIGMGILFVYSFMKSTEAWANSLKASEERFRDVLANSKDVLLKFDFIEDRFVYISPGLVDILGYESDEWMEGGKEAPLSQVHPDDVDVLLEEVSKFGPDMREEDYSNSLEFRIRNKAGEYRWVNLNQNLVHDVDGSSRAIVANLRDVTAKKELYEALRKSHDEKEMLLREIHHRIKNNLSIISSILELQKSDTDNRTREILNECQTKIMSISKIHEKLYKSADLGKVRMDKYLRDLVNELVSTYSSENMDIRLLLNLARFEMGVNQAVPCGLVLSEVITNVYKHGFREREKGELVISSVKEQDLITITVENDGNPFAEDSPEDSRESFGTKMIRAFLETMNGSYTVESSERTRVTVRFLLSEGHEKEVMRSQRA